MRKAFGIVVGCILLCGLVVAMLAVPPQTVTINGDKKSQGVDKPWFELSVGAGDEVNWKNGTNNNCTVLFGPQTPFDDEAFQLDAKGKPGDQSVLYKPKPTKVGPKPAGWGNDVYFVFKYTVVCGKDHFDPGGGIRP